MTSMTLDEEIFREALDPSLSSLNLYTLTMAANPIERVTQQLEQMLPSGAQSPHLSGAETPPPFAWGGAAGSPGEPVTPSNGKRKTRLACLTSGGDSAGMNAAVRAVVKMAIARSVFPSRCPCEEMNAAISSYTTGSPSKGGR